MDDTSPQIVVEHSANLTIATMTAEKILDEADIQALEKSVMPLIVQNPRIDLLISFENVRFLSSAVLGLLIRISKKVYEADGRLRLCSIDPKLLQIFKITRLDKIFDIYEDRDKAQIS